MADKDRFREAEQRLKLAGFDLVRQSGHHVWRHPDKRQIVVASTPGEGRGWYNLKARLKRMGIPELNEYGVVKQGYNPRIIYVEAPTTNTTPVLGIMYRRDLKNGRRSHQVSVAEVLSAAETLKGKDGGLGQREKWMALGKVMYLFLDQNTDIREVAIEYASTMEPDYETVFRGEFNCRAPMPDGAVGCGKKMFTPASQGAHERRIHQYIHQHTEPVALAPVPTRPTPQPSIHASPLVTPKIHHERQPQKCGVCRQEGHNSRTCRHKTG